MSNIISSVGSHSEGYNITPKSNQTMAEALYEANSANIKELISMVETNGPGAYSLYYYYDNGNNGSGARNFNIFIPPEAIVDGKLSASALNFYNPGSSPSYDISWLDRYYENEINNQKLVATPLAAGGIKSNGGNIGIHFAQQTYETDNPYSSIYTGTSGEMSNVSSKLLGDIGKILGTNEPVSFYGYSALGDQSLNGAVAYLRDNPNAKVNVYCVEPSNQKPLQMSPEDIEILNNSNAVVLDIHNVPHMSLDNVGIPGSNNTNINSGLHYYEVTVDAYADPEKTRKLENSHAIANQLFLGSDFNKLTSGGFDWRYESEGGNIPDAMHITDQPRPYDAYFDIKVTEHIPNEDGTVTTREIPLKEMNQITSGNDIVESNPEYISEVVNRLKITVNGSSVAEKKNVLVSNGSTTQYPQLGVSIYEAFYKAMDNLKNKFEIELQAVIDAGDKYTELDNSLAKLELLKEVDNCSISPLFLQDNIDLFKIDLDKFKEDPDNYFNLWIANKKYFLEDFNRPEIMQKFGFNTPEEALEAFIGVVIVECGRNKDINEALAVTSVALNRCTNESWINEYNTSNPLEQMFASGGDQYEPITRIDPETGLHAYETYMPSRVGQEAVDKKISEHGDTTYEELKETVLTALEGGLRNNDYLGFYASGDPLARRITNSGNHYHWASNNINYIDEIKQKAANRTVVETGLSNIKTIQVEEGADLSDLDNIRQIPNSANIKDNNTLEDLSEDAQKIKELEQASANNQNGYTSPTNNNPETTTNGNSNAGTGNANTNNNRGNTGHHGGLGMPGGGYGYTGPAPSTVEQTKPSNPSEPTKSIVPDEPTKPDIPSGSSPINPTPTYTIPSGTSSQVIKEDPIKNVIIEHQENMGPERLEPGTVNNSEVKEDIPTNVITPNTNNAVRKESNIGKGILTAAGITAAVAGAAGAAMYGINKAKENNDLDEEENLSDDEESVNDEYNISDEI